MHARVVLGVGKGVLFREVSSIQECPHREREREVPLYTYTTHSESFLHVFLSHCRENGREMNYSVDIVVDYDRMHVLHVCYISIDVWL